MKEVHFNNFYIDGVSTTKPLFNEALTTGEYICKTIEDSLYLIPSSNFFGENKYNNNLIKRCLNSQIEDVINKNLANLPEIEECLAENNLLKKGHSTRHKANTLRESQIKELTRGVKDSDFNVYTINIQPTEKQLEKIKTVVGILNNSAEKENVMYLDEVLINLNKQSDRVGVCNDQIASDYFKRKKDENKFPEGMGWHTMRRGHIHKYTKPSEQGVKESAEKVDYSEINLDILDLMAERINKNKFKYPKGNSLKPMNIEDLEQALFRHVKKLIQKKETDEETYEDHLSAILCNASFILNQLQIKK